MSTVTLAAVALRKWRRGHELTQMQVASLLGMTQATYSLLESGRRRPQRDTAARIEAGTSGRVRMGMWTEGAPRRPVRPVLISVAGLDEASVAIVQRLVDGLRDPATVEPLRQELEQLATQLRPSANRSEPGAS